MSRTARVEEIEDDSDPEEMDIDSLGPNEIMSQNSLMRPADIPSSSRADSMPALQPHFPGRPPANQEADKQRTRHYQCLYPVYFDATRSRAEGRRVGKELAVPNPLAREIVDAVSQMGLAGQVVFEPGKCHPKDWANPGRVRVLIKEDGKPAGRGHVKNKHHLYILVAQHLRAHPTTEQSPMRLRIQGMPLPDKPIPPPAVPRGWKMGTILPLHSPALSGGGVNENFMKDMMAEMQAAGGMPGMPQIPPGMAGMLGGGDSGSAGPSKKKDRKEGKKGK